MTQDKPRLSQAFFERLYKLGRSERAVLARALNEERPAAYVPAFAIVEPYCHDTGWKRDCLYLVAALFGKLEKETPNERADGVNFAKAVRQYARGDNADGGLGPTERRFLTLLDADAAELPYRLRQMATMITTGANRIQALLNWPNLLDDLTKWNFESRRTQQSWAQDFYQSNDQEEKE